MRFDSLNAPPAELTEQARAQLAARHTAAMHAARWCNMAGVPGMMLGPRPLDFASNDQELAISVETPSAPRHISLARREHVSLDLLDPETDGDSIARWDGTSLLVDTTGFNEKGINEIPGGGFRTGTSHLIERYRLIDGGAHLEAVLRGSIRRCLPGRIDPTIPPRRHRYGFTLHAPMSRLDSTKERVTMESVYQ